MLRVSRLRAFRAEALVFMGLGFKTFRVLGFREFRNFP